MTNAIDIKALRGLAKRASERIDNPIIAERYEALAMTRLLKDPRNFRPARNTDITHAPQWAKDAHDRGDPLHVVRVNRASAARIHTVALRLAKTCKVAATDPMGRPDDLDTITAARKFLRKIDNANFDIVARKTLQYSRTLDRWEELSELLAVCPERSIVLLGGRIWHRITSVAALRLIGAEFGNCLARSTRTSAYGALLMNGRAQFWVLRTVAGAGLMVAMASTHTPVQFTEVKGPRNAPVRADDPNLVQLGIAIGVPAPPPIPDPPIPPGIAAAVLVARAPCMCRLCQPRLLRSRRTAI
ncbi:MAG: hypothetical protein NT015_12125 [Alphaproteobacteria bacterium]|nr:hypothetical protein [Alphaproteobacteria bacterium]